MSSWQLRWGKYMLIDWYMILINNSAPKSPHSTTWGLKVKGTWRIFWANYIYTFIHVFIRIMQLQRNYPKVQGKSGVQCETIWEQSAQQILHKHQKFVFCCPHTQPSFPNSTQFSFKTTVSLKEMMGLCGQNCIVDVFWKCTTGYCFAMTVSLISSSPESIGPCMGQCPVMLSASSSALSCLTGRSKLCASSNK